MAELVKDPVCNMEIDPRESLGKSEYRGVTYYFCSETCKRDFDADPQKYLGAEAPAAEAAPAGPSAGAPTEAAPRKRWWEFWK